MRNSEKQVPANLTEASIYFISDAHLPADDPESEDRLVTFLHSIKGKTGFLYILGDLFDFWFEYKSAIPAAYLRTLSAILSLTEGGVKVTYLPGNHDFWMRDYLQRQAGVTLAGEHFDVEHQRKKIHLVHGDGLARGDTGYKILKHIFRFKPNIWLYHLLPVDLAYSLARQTSRASREYTSAKSRDFQGYYDYAEAKIRSGFDAVIMGHTHFPEIKEIGGGLYINTGDWIEHCTIVVLEHGQFRLEYFK